jgi:hypothetical protein
MTTMVSICRFSKHILTMVTETSNSAVIGQLRSGTVTSSDGAEVENCSVRSCSSFPSRELVLGILSTGRVAEELSRCSHDACCVGTNLMD